MPASETRFFWSRALSIEGDDAALEDQDRSI
jgi:hypothetical protein